MARKIPCTIGIDVDDLFHLKEQAAELRPTTASDYRQPTYATLIRQLIAEHLHPPKKAAPKAARKGGRSKR